MREPSTSSRQKTYFLHTVNEEVVTHLCDPAFDVSKLLRLIGMSRSDFHRKLKASSGMSATEYIRYLRLRKAASLLLEQPDWCILYIAMEVGFNDHSYFTKRFRELYGVCPANFRSQRVNLEHIL